MRSARHPRCGVDIRSGPSGSRLRRSPRGGCREPRSEFLVARCKRDNGSGPSRRRAVNALAIPLKVATPGPDLGDHRKKARRLRCRLLRSCHARLVGLPASSRGLPSFRGEHSSSANTIPGLPGARGLVAAPLEDLRRRGYIAVVAPNTAEMPAIVMACRAVIVVQMPTVLSHECIERGRTGADSSRRRPTNCAYRDADGADRPGVGRRSTSPVGSVSIACCAMAR